MNILLISKYASSREFSFESRLFTLARLFSNYEDTSVTIVSSDANHLGRYPYQPKIFNVYHFGRLRNILIKTWKYKKTISISRILSWIDFEIKVFFLPKKIIRKPDIVIVSSLSLLTILNGIFLKWKYNSKLVFEIRDIWPLNLIEQGNYSHKNIFVLILSFIERLGYKKADLIVGTMPNLKDHVKEVVKKEIEVAFIPFGYDDETNTTRLKNNLDEFISLIPEDKFIIGYAGSIGKVNGLNSIVECIKRLENFPKIHFIFIGDGDLKSKYMSELSSKKNVTFFPRIEKQNVRYILNKCDLLYFSSLNNRIWNYGWSPNKIIEYMLSGKPILASYSGHRSMVNEANSGFFVPAEDTDALESEILRIYNLPSSRLKKMGEQGRKWILANRDFDTIAKTYMNHLKNL